MADEAVKPAATVDPFFDPSSALFKYHTEGKIAAAMVTEEHLAVQAANQEQVKEAVEVMTDQEAINQINAECKIEAAQATLHEKQVKKIVEGEYPPGFDLVLPK